MSSKGEREKRKALLLSQIQQQRLDLSASRRDWLETTGAYDRGWNTVLSLRSWALVGSSVMAIWTIRHPNMLVRWAKRGLGIWSAWRLVKTTLRQQQLASRHQVITWWRDTFMHIVSLAITQIF
ncbi:YqjK-like family protein [Salmonella enterica]|nr:YqjK-like family protein [Salmonella enterica]